MIAVTKWMVMQWCGKLEIALHMVSVPSRLQEYIPTQIIVEAKYLPERRLIPEWHLLPPRV